MTQTVRGPDGKVHNFPDQASPQQINTIMRKLYGMPAQQQQPAPAPETTTQPQPGSDQDTTGFLGRRALGSAVGLLGAPADLLDSMNSLGVQMPGVLNAAQGARRLQRVAFGTEPGAMAPLGSENVKETLYAAAPRLRPREAQGDTERYMGAVADFAGASAVPAAGLAGRVSRPLAFLTGEAAAATAGGIGQEAARDAAPNSPWAPLAGALVGSLSPQAAVSGLRGFVRGGKQGAVRAQQAIDDMAAIGAKPTLQQATTDSYWPGRLLSRLLEVSPGGILPSYGRWKSQLEGAAKRLDDALAKSGVPAEVSQATAGMALEAGAARFARKVSRTQAGLEAKLEQAVPGRTVVAPTNTIRALEDMTALGRADDAAQPAAVAPSATATAQAPVAGRALGSSPLGQTNDISKGAFDRRFGEATGGASEVGEAATNPTLQKYLTAFANDTAKNGGTPFAALKKFRTLVGGKTPNGEALIGNMSSGELKQLYKALSKDMEDAATAAGKGGLVKLRNDYYSSRKGELEDVFDARITRPGTPEAVFRSVQNADKSQLQQIMRQLSPQERRTVAARVLIEMAMPNPGNATGDTARFSFGTFDTNFEKLNRRGVLDDLFHLSGTKELKSALSDLAKASELSKGSSRFLRNPSETGIMVGQQAGAGTMLAATATLDLSTGLQAALWTYAVPYALMKGGNSTAFIKLLTQTARAPKEALPGQIARLAAFAQANPGYAPAIKKSLDEAFKGEQPQGSEQAQQQ